jgi:ribosomal protein L32
MSKIDNKKVAKAARRKYSWHSDLDPPKTQRSEKRRERQDGKREIANDLKICPKCGDFMIVSRWGIYFCGNYFCDADAARSVR